MFASILEQILTGQGALWPIVALSMKVSLTACLISACVAIPLGAVIAMTEFWGKRLVLVFSNALMALPPVVVGLVVYLLLSRAGPLGSFGILFTPKAMIIAQTILIFPIILSFAIEAITPLERSYRRLLKSVHASFWFRMKTLIIDARFALATAILAGFGRAIAEVGAVLIVGGNIDGLTRVMTTTIALETSKGNLELALGLGVVLVAIAFLVNAAIHLIKLYDRKYQEAIR